MFGHAILPLLGFFSLFCLSSALPTPSVASPLGDISLSQNGVEVANNVSAGPPGLTFNFEFNDRHPINTLQAENMIIVAMAQLAQGNTDNYVRDRKIWLTREFPEVIVLVEPSGPTSMKIIHLLWALVNLHGGIVRAKESSWVACSNTLFLNGNRVGAVGLVPKPRNGQLTLQDASNTSSVADVSNPVFTDLPDFSSRMTRSSSPNSDSDSDSDIEVSSTPSSFPSSSASPVDNNDIHNSTSLKELTLGPLTTNTRFLGRTNLGEQNLYLMYSNTILALADDTHFAPDLFFRIRNQRLRISMSINPPLPQRTRPPMNTKKDSIKVVARTALFTANERRFDELETVARIDGIIIQNTVFAQYTVP